MKAQGLTVISFGWLPEREAPPIDINALQRADIRKRDWSAMHIAADRRPPVDIEAPRKRTWHR